MSQGQTNLPCLSIELKLSPFLLVSTCDTHKAHPGLELGGHLLLGHLCLDVGHCILLLIDSIFVAILASAPGPRSYQHHPRLVRRAARVRLDVLAHCFFGDEQLAMPAVSGKGSMSGKGSVSGRGGGNWTGMGRELVKKEWSQGRSGEFCGRWGWWEDAHFRELEGKVCLSCSVVSAMEAREQTSNALDNIVAWHGRKLA
jgi:hypothetical protein